MLSPFSNFTTINNTNSHPKYYMATNKLINKVLNCCNTPFGVADFVITIPSSMGIAQAPMDGIDAAILLQKAGAAMTISKADGSTHSFFNQDTQAALNLRYQLESHLVDALNKNELSLHYQPFINLKTQQVIGAESQSGPAAFERDTLGRRIDLDLHRHGCADALCREP